MVELDFYGLFSNLDIDFFIGLPLEEEHTMSRLSQPSYAYLLREILYDPRVIIVLAIIHLGQQTSLTKRILENPDWIKLSGVGSFFSQKNEIFLRISTHSTRQNFIDSNKQLPWASLKPKTLGKSLP